MEINDRERAVLIRDLCRRIGDWNKTDAYQAFNESTMNAIREDASRLVELLDARQLSLLRKQGKAGVRDYSEEG